jgi:hypothetical protein
LYKSAVKVFDKKFIEYKKEVSFYNFGRAIKHFLSNQFFKLMLSFLKRADIKRLREVCRMWNKLIRPNAILLAIINKVLGNVKAKSVKD